MTGNQIYYLPTSGAPVPINSTVDPATGTVSAGLPHFSTYVVASGVWTITLDGTGNHTAILHLDNSTLQLILDGTLVSSAPISSVTSIAVIGTSTSTVNDTLTIAISGGALPNVPISFTGGGGVNTLNIPEELAGSSWIWNGTTLTGTSSDSPVDFGTVTATRVQNLQLDGSQSNSLTGPPSTHTWTILGSQAVSIAGLTASGVSSLTGSGSDTLQSAVPTADISVLGLSYTGIHTVTQVQGQSFTFQGLPGGNAIELGSDSSSPYNLKITDTVTDPGSGTSTVTTIPLIAPSSTLTLEGTADTAQITIDPSPSFTGTYVLDAGSGQLTLTGGAATLALAQPAGQANVSDARQTDIVLSGSDLSVSVDTNQILVPSALITSTLTINTDNNDNTITLDRSGGAFTVPVTITGGTGANELDLTNLTAGSAWTWDGDTTSGTAASSGTDFKPIAFTNVQTIAVSEAGTTPVTNSLNDAGTADQTWTITGTGAGSIDGLQFSGITSVAPGSSTNNTLVTPVSPSGGTVLGVSYPTGSIKTTTIAASDSGWWVAPTGNNTISLADGSLSDGTNTLPVFRSLTTARRSSLPARARAGHLHGRREQHRHRRHPDQPDRHAVADRRRRH